MEIELDYCCGIRTFDRVHLHHKFHKDPISTSLLIWGLYEIYDVDEPDQMSLYHNNNLTLFPLSDIHIRNEETTQLEVTVFRFRF